MRFSPEKIKRYLDSPNADRFVAEVLAQDVHDAVAEDRLTWEEFGLTPKELQAKVNKAKTVQLVYSKDEVVPGGGPVILLKKGEFD